MYIIESGRVAENNATGKGIAGQGVEGSGHRSLCQMDPYGIGCKSDEFLREEEGYRSGPRRTSALWPEVRSNKLIYSLKSFKVSWALLERRMRKEVVEDEDERMENRKWKLVWQV